MTEAFLSEAPRVIGHGYRVAFRFAAGRLDAVWEPRQPPLRGQMLRRYRRERDAFLTRLAAEVGGRVACVEVSL